MTEAQPIQDSMIQQQADETVDAHIVAQKKRLNDCGCNSCSYTSKDLNRWVNGRELTQEQFDEVLRSL